MKLISKKNQLPHGLAHSINSHFITANVVFFMFNSDFVKKNGVKQKNLTLDKVLNVHVLQTYTLSKTLFSVP